MKVEQERGISVTTSVMKFAHRDCEINLLDLHPVAGGMAGGLARLDSPGHLDGATKQQQLFGKGGFTGIRMADDAEGTAAADFV
jgi:hypothetical protein